MALTYTQVATICNDSIFLQRINFAMLIGAVTVIGEAANTSKHTGRLAYAMTVLQGNFSASTIANAVMTQLINTASSDPTLILDSDIQTVINNNWNILAGI